MDFAVNTNAFGPPAALHEQLRYEDLLTIYPDHTYEKTRASIASLCGVNADQVLVGVGATEFLFALPRVFAEATSFTTVRPSFWEYEEAFRVAGNVRPRILQLHEDNDFELDINELDALAARSDLVVICNPNNPTSTICDSAQLRVVIESHPRTTFVVDETYLLFRHDFQERSLGRDVEQMENLIVIGSLSKVFAIPGVRAGYALASSTLLQRLKCQLTPYGLGSIGEKAVQLAINDVAFLATIKSAYRTERESYIEKFQNVDLPVRMMRPEANYVYASVMKGMTSARLDRELQALGFLVRDCTPFLGANGEWVRFAIKSEVDNRLLVSALHSIGKEANAQAIVSSR